MSIRDKDNERSIDRIDREIAEEIAREVTGAIPPQAINIEERSVPRRPPYAGETGSPQATPFANTPFHVIAQHKHVQVMREVKHGLTVMRDQLADMSLDYETRMLAARHTFERKQRAIMQEYQEEVDRLTTEYETKAAPIDEIMAAYSKIDN